MPEYLAPGVYIEEVSYRQKTIEGVSTSTAGFVGPARFGPIQGEPELLTNYGAFERIFSGMDPLSFGDPPNERMNYLAQSVQSFFEEGGQRLYVSRAFLSYLDARRVVPPGMNATGVALHTIDDPASPPAGRLTIAARWPGAAGNVSLRFTGRMGLNILASVPRDPTNPGSSSIDPVLQGILPFDTVWIADARSPVDSPITTAVGAGTLYWADRYFNTDPTLGPNRWTWRFVPEPTVGETREQSILRAIPVEHLDPGMGHEVRIVTVTVEVVHPGRFPRRNLYEDLALDPPHQNSMLRRLGGTLANRDDELTTPVVVTTSSPLTGPSLARVILGQGRTTHVIDRLTRLWTATHQPDPSPLLSPPASPPTSILTEPLPGDLSILGLLGWADLGAADRTYEVLLTGGNDGVRPTATAYLGRGDDDPAQASGLKAFEHVADISIVAAPGSTDQYATNQADVDQTVRHLIGHCERMRYRIAVLDCPENHSVGQIRAFRGALDSKHAALYYPWVTALDPISGEARNFPPSGSVAGIYARNDIERGVHKAPANEVVRQAIGFEKLLNKGHQDVLNPEGVNCLRYLEGRGYRVWGARTITSDPEWKYVNLRRYFAYLERSIERGTQWAVFEPNGDTLWRNVRQTIEDFLFNEWQNDRLFGLKPQDAFFVRCDRSTMSQNDIDNGRLVCLIGVAPLRPAEFVVFRIGQWTASAKN